MEQRKLYRSRSNRMICGVCGGLGEYFNVDATIVRLAMVLVCLWFCSGIVAYLIAAIIIPDEPLPPGTSNGYNSGNTV